MTQAAVERIHVAVRLRHDWLICIERWKSLNLDQLGLQVLVDSEIHLEEQRVGRLIRNIVFGGDGGRGSSDIFGAGEQLSDQLLAVADHLVDQCRREKAGGLAIAERD